MTFGDNRKNKSRKPGVRTTHRGMVRVVRAAHLAIERLEPRALFTVTTGTPAQATLDSSYVAGDLGLNLSSDDSFSTQALFTDARKTMAAWTYPSSNGTVLSGADLLKNGYPSGTSASNGATTESDMYGYPDGIYTLAYQGSGTIGVSGSGAIVSSSSSTMNGVTTTTAQVAIKKDTAGSVILTATNFTTASPLSNLHLMMPGYSVNTTQVFNPAVIARLKTFSTTRLMDLFRANNSNLANWSDRSLPTDFTATGGYGISYEDAIALGNETNTNLWWNIPIDATDDFVTKVAEIIKYGSDANGNPYTSTQTNPVNPPLNSNLKVHIELANEIWNIGTTANTDNHTAALANETAGYLTGSGDALDGAESLFRLRQIRDDFAGVYGASLSSQIGFIWTADFNTQYGTAQTYTTGALAFARSNNGATGDNNPANWGTLNSWLEAMATSDYHGLLSGQDPTTQGTLAAQETALFNYLNADLSEYGPSAIQDMVAYATQYNLPLVAYEGGVALTPTSSAQLTLYGDASTDPRMDAFNQAMLNEWYANGGKQYNYYALATDYDDYFGDWGALEYEDQAGTNKFDALIKRLVTPGDANLDGSVDFNDFLALKANWLKSTAYWQQGDFNSDGTVNAADLTILNSAINKSAFTTAQLAEYNSFYQFAMNGTASTSVGTGLYGSYFSDLNQTTKVYGRVDPTVDFSWPQGGTGPDPSVGQSYFSTQWTGQIEAPTTENYEIHTFSDDGIRVYITVNGTKTLLINDYTTGSHEDVGDVALQAGQKYAIEVDYFQEYGNANVKLEWQTATIPLQDIPTTMMYPTPLPAVPTTVKATGGTGSIAITFPAVSGATSYNIYRSTSPGGEGATPYLTGITGSGTITATDNSVTAGRTYYYTVTALNIVGETAQSAEASAAATAPAGTAAAPVVSIAGGSGFIKLSWPAVTGATSYSIYRGTSAGGEAVKSLISGVTTAGYTDSTVLPGTTYYYTVTADNNFGSSTFSNETSAVATVPPQPSLADLDVGSPSMAGSASYNSTNGTYTVKGGGADIYGVGDQFNYDYTTLTGDQTLIAKVATETNTNYSTKAGLMFRQDTTNTSNYADVLVTPGQGVVFEWRSNGNYSSTAVAGITAPAWVKLTRSGNTFTGYYSLDGISWTQVSSQAVSMNSSALTGMAVCAHDNSQLATATFSNLQLGTGPVITSNPSAAVAANGKTAALSASASESGSTLTYTWSVSSLPNGVTNADTPTFSASNGTANGNAVTATFTKAGTYGFTLTVTDASGTSTVAPLSVTVTQLLTTASLIPASPVSVAAGASVTFAATGLDQFGVAMATQPTFIYSIDTGGTGTINTTTGVYTAPAAPGSATIRATSGSVSTTAAETTTTSGTQTPTQLTGTVIGTSGSYDGASNDTASAAFDGNLSTYFDAPAANASNATVGLDLLSQKTLTSIKFAPRATFESRMVGGYFQGSNSSTFATATTLYTITAAPADGLTTISVTGNYRYVRYVAPANSYGNIAEMQVFGTAVVADSQPPTPPGTPTLVGASANSAAFTWVASTDNVAVDHYVIYRGGTQVGTSMTNSYTDTGLTAGSTYSYTVIAVDPSGNMSTASGSLSVTTPSQLTGTVIGTSGSYDGASNDTASAAFDGNLNTYFDAPAAYASGAYVGLDLGTAKTLTSISYAPRATFESRMTGGYFQGSNSADFSNATTLYTISGTPVDGLTTVTVSGSYRYVRYVAPANSYGNIAEMQVFGSAGVPDTQAPTMPGTPTLTSATTTTVAITWTASTDNVGVDHYVIYRGGAQVGTSTTNSYTDGNLTPNTSYTYTVTAVDAAGNASAASGGLGVMTLAGSAPTQLTGMVIGTSGSYDGLSTDTASAAFDGSLTTYFDAPAANASNATVGLDLLSAKSLTSISYAPRATFEYRMVGGYFQGSNSASFTNATTLYTISTAPADGLTSVVVSGTFRYVRYVAPANSYGDIAEMQVFGTASSDTQAPTMPGTPTLVSASATTASITWAASTDNVGVDHYVIYRGGTQVGTSTTNSYNDTGLTAATGYSYTVTAVDLAGNASAASTALAVTTPKQLTGTVFGTSGSYDGQASDSISAVVDGSTTTYFDAPSANANNAIVGIDLGTAHSLTSISFAPRATFESRMVGGYFQVSNTADFSTATTVYTVTAAPVDGLTTVAISGSYRYIRYVAPSGSYGNVAEMQVFGA